MNEFRWERLRADQLREIASQDPVVIVPVGSIEQHGSHLPTGCDSMIGTEVCHAAARHMIKTGPVVVTPTVWTGISPHHVEFGGTLTLDTSTFFGVIRCLCDSIRGYGIRKIVYLNAHGGNSVPLQVIVSDLAREYDLPLVALDYYRLIMDVWKEVLDHPSELEHAGEAETSMLMHIAPELVEEAHLAGAFGPVLPEVSSFVGDQPYRWRSFATRTETGVLGNAEQSSAEKGATLLEEAASRLANVLSTAELWELPTWKNRQ